MTFRDAGAVETVAFRSVRRCFDQATIHLVITAILLPFGAGCLPEGVVWLPDSSGVIYTDKDGARLNHYDLRKKATRVIRADTGTRTVWPAVSPDGSRVAVARLLEIQPPNSKTKTVETQVIIYALDGTEVHRSRVHPAKQPSEASSTPGESLEETVLVWPTKDAIGISGCGWYQVSNERFEGVPVGPMVFGASPDGEAFLGIDVDEKKGTGKLAYVDKDGWIQVSDQVFGHDEDLHFVQWRWVGPVATGLIRNKTWRIDTRDMSVTETDRQLESPIPNAEVAFAHDFPEKKTRMYGLDLDDANGETTGVLDLHSLETKKFRRLMTQDRGFTRLANLKLFPSPCDRFVAARVVIDGEDRIRIYDGGIEPVADIRCEE